MEEGMEDNLPRPSLKAFNPTLSGQTMCLTSTCMPLTLHSWVLSYSHVVLQFSLLAFSKKAREKSSRAHH